MLQISTVSDESLRSRGIYDLESLGSQAAIELDNHLIGRDTGVEATLLVAQWLQDCLDWRLGNAQIADCLILTKGISLDRLMIETGMLGLVEHTVAALRTATELACKRLQLVAHQIKELNEENKEELKCMRDFCLQLSRLAACDSSNHFRDHLRG